MSIELRRIVQGAIDDNPDTTVQDIAAAAAKKVPAKQLRGYLAEALVDLVRVTIGDSRRRSMDSLSNSSNSAKKRDCANWWAQMLTERVNVNGTWITLGECTFDDLQACIDDREQLIARINGQIDNYHRLQKLLRQHSVDRVSDIPAQTEWDKPL